MNLFLFGYVISQLEQSEPEVPSYIGYGTYNPTKLQRWLKEHPVIDRAYPCIIGTIIGLLPISISMILLYVYGLL